MSEVATHPDAVSEEGRRPSLLGRLVLGVLWLYQRTALVRTPRCRFHPTCSSYAVESIRVHGALRGMGHALARIARCHPWHPGGIDPVKPPTHGRSTP
jgi:uncharacterized protein